MLPVIASGPVLALALALAASATASAQVAWTAVAPASSPPARYVHAIATEPLGRVLLFGGGNGTGNSTGNGLQDTWLYDGTTWARANPAASPPQRLGHGLVHDLARGRTILFGGSSNATGPNLLYGDTWEWDGATWLQANPGQAPPARSQFGMVWDQRRGRTVLFGGHSGPWRNDTWEWDGTNWRPVVTAVSPSPRCCTPMAYDVARGQVVLFGGHDGSMLADTWEYDGINWRQRQPTLSPPPRCCAQLAYDQARGRTVLFGGAIGTINGEYNDTWEWDGTDWRQRSTATTPSVRRGLALTYDVFREQIVLFGGGQDGSGNLLFGDTWLHAPITPATVAPFGTGCAGTVGTPTLTAPARPWVGDAWSLTLAPVPTGAAAAIGFGLSRTAWGPDPLPLSLAAVGMPGCELRIAPDAIAAATTAGAVATLIAPIPVNPALVGLVVYLQGQATDPAANPGGTVFSNGLAIRVGGR